MKSVEGFLRASATGAPHLTIRARQAAKQRKYNLVPTVDVFVVRLVRVR
jgi:hypothetical protein